jgi:hypothetical protein
MAAVGRVVGLGVGLVSVGLVWGLATLAVTAPARSQDTTPAAEVTWRKLAFTATKLLVTAHADVAFEWREPAEVSGELLTDVPGLPIVPRARLGAIELGSRFLSRRSSTTLLFDPSSLEAYQSSSRDYGKRNRLKVYRYGHDGVFTRRLRPASVEEGALEPEAWSDRSEQIHPLRADGVLSDPASLFYLLSVADPSDYAKGGTMMAFSRSQAQPIEIDFVGVEPLRVSFDLHGPSSPEDDPERIDGEVETLHYALRPAAEAEEFQLLGLEGDLDLWIEVARRIPVQVSGRVSPLGKVVVRLEEAWLRGPGDAVEPPGPNTP